MPLVVMLIAVGDAGVAVFTATVLIDAGALARLVWLTLNGPPKPPTVVFCTFTVAVLLLLKLQL